MSAPAATLLELCDAGSGDAFGDWTKVHILGISTDSRQVRQGDLFFGLPGTATDGARYAKEALWRGAAAVVLPEGAEIPPGAAGLLSPDPFAALASAARRLYGDPARELDIVGITGTNGKTTTALLTAHLLRAHGDEASSWTTTLVEIGRASFRPQWTTPPAHELQRFLRTAVDEGVRRIVMEVSSHAIPQQRIAGIDFAVGIATNFSPDHLDFHGTVERYHAAKHAFIQGIGDQAMALLNADDPAILAMREGARARIVTFGRSESADVRVRGVETSAHSVQGWLEVRGGVLGNPARYPFRLPMTGDHNALNAAAAFAAAVWLGVPPSHATRALRFFSPPPRRLQRQRVGPYVIYNDVAMNEASYDAVLRTLAQTPPEQLVVVHALRGNRGAEVNARIAQIFSRWDGRLRFSPLIVSESRLELSRGGVDRTVRPEERDAFRAAAEKLGLHCLFHVELDAAIAEAVTRLAPGGVLLLLGTFGMDRGPSKARAMLRARLGLPAQEEADYLSPQLGGF